MIVNQNAIQRAAVRNSTKESEIKDVMKVFMEIREVLTKSEDIVEIIHLFGMENEGFLT